MSSSIKVGSVEIVSVSDAVAPDPLAMFFPGVSPEQWEPFQKLWPDAFDGPTMLRSNYGCFLIRSGGRSIFVDTGLGPNPPRYRPGNLPMDLKLKGIEPVEVDTVFITHAHFDHIGWNLDPGSGKPFFPRARYLLSRVEWELMAQYEEGVVRLGLPRYLDGTIRPLESLGVLDLVDGEQALDANVTAIATPGHTPGHMSVLVSSDREKAVIGGDVLIHPAQITQPEWQPVVDRDKERAVATRLALIDRLEAEGMTIAAGHFPAPGFGAVVRIEGRRYWQARQ